MTQLSSNDYNLLLDFVGKLHVFRSRSTLRAWLLDDALPRLVPSDWLSYNEVDLLNPHNTIAVLKPESDLFFQRLFPRFKELAHQHPLIVRQMESVDFPVHKISDFLTGKAYHKLELYREVYQPMGVEYQMAATIRISPNQITAFALSRHAPDYTERDRTVLELLRPHLVVAFNNLDLLQSQRALLDGTELAMKELSSATLMVDAQGLILYHTGPGRQWIGAGSPGRLPAPIAHWLNALCTNGNREVLRWNSGGGDILIRAVPTSSPERHLLVLSKRNNSSRNGAAAGVAGLSRREQEVARWIREGKTNGQIAVIMGISPRTVQKHIENIFEKLGVDSRVAVATRLQD